MSNPDFYRNDGDEAVGLLMTHRCNLACKYCYIREKADIDMPLEMAKSILEPFLENGTGKLDVVFMGGETLLAMNVIKPLVEWVEKGASVRKIRFFGSTNGTLLTPELKAWLKRHSGSITLGLSYDGIPASQIQNRGNDNIDVKFFLETWPKQPIQMTIDSESVDKMADGVIYLLERGALVHPNVAYEEKEWSENSLLEYGRQLEKLISYYSHHPEKPLVSQFIHDLDEYADKIGRLNEPAQICGAGNGFQVYDTNGLSYPCHILSPLVLEGEKLQKVISGRYKSESMDIDIECKSCPFISDCPTCIACNYLYRDGIWNRDRTHCEIMKTEVRAFIKMEVLRLSAKEELSPEDAQEIDSIRKLYNYKN